MSPLAVWVGNSLDYHQTVESLFTHGSVTSVLSKLCLDIRFKPTYAARHDVLLQLQWRWSLVTLRQNLNKFTVCWACRCRSVLSMLRCYMSQSEYQNTFLSNHQIGDGFYKSWSFLSCIANFAKTAVLNITNTVWKKTTKQTSWVTSRCRHYCC